MWKLNEEFEFIDADKLQITFDGPKGRSGLSMHIKIKNNIEMYKKHLLNAAKEICEGSIR